jgi:hypothetical protein
VQVSGAEDLPQTCRRPAADPLTHKDFFVSKKKYNIILVFIYRLSKKLISIPC